MSYYIKILRQSRDCPKWKITSTKILSFCKKDHLFLVSKNKAVSFVHIEQNWLMKLIYQSLTAISNIWNFSAKSQWKNLVWTSLQAIKPTGDRLLWAWIQWQQRVNSKSSYLEIQIQSHLTDQITTLISKQWGGLNLC